VPAKVTTLNDTAVGSETDAWLATHCPALLQPVNATVAPYANSASERERSSTAYYCTS